MATLERADLTRAHLTGANLRETQLTGANLHEAQLEGADLGSAQLTGANLGDASFDKASALNGATMTGVSLDQATFENTDLSVVDWRTVPRLGDELQAHGAKDEQGKRKDRSARREEFQAAVRAYRRLAVALQANGLSEDASRYLYRAQICQRTTLFYEGRILQWLGSSALAALAGYGFRPGRSILRYLGIIAGFNVLYMQATRGWVPFGLPAPRLLPRYLGMSR